MSKRAWGVLAAMAIAGPAWAACSTVAADESADAVVLPGEPAMKPALAPDPFPDRLSAYVWRNWFLVPKTLLADVVSATPDELTEVAREMGLPSEPTVLPEWRTKGYITVLRRNWHLLPYGQIMKLLGKTREQLKFSLIEDDFLWYKLGRVKPKCEELVYDKAEASETRSARRRIAAILKEEGLNPAAPEEPRFAFVKELAAPLPESGKRAGERAKDAAGASPFDFRLIFSYFADYADPLGDPAVGSFPEGLLQRLSEQGVNAVWLHTVLRTLAKDPKYPEFGEGCERRIANLQTLVDRAKRYGIRVYLYMNEPRGLTPDFFAKPGREGLAGATADGLQAMCTLNPETQRWLSDSLEKVFSSVRGLGGIFTITASENLTNCATRPGFKETCPVCRSHSRAEIIAAANNAMIRGMLKGDPRAEAILYDWAWPREEMSDLLARLPQKSVRIMSVSEDEMPIRRGGVAATESDYSISIVGPGEAARATWKQARARGVETVAKVQANNSWELSSYPYVPTMDLVAQHAVNLANEGVRGVMLSWSLGCSPAPNLRVYRDLRKGERTADPLLDRLAADLYGSANVKRVRQAWKAFSDGFANYPFACNVIYFGPHQWGPANPLYLKPTDWRATMVGIPYDDVDDWRAQYPAETYVDLMQKVADGFAEGCRLMDGVADRRELDMFRAEQMHFASCADQVRFVLARDRGDDAAMRRVAADELARAKEFWRLVRADSRFGYESSNHYFFTPIDVLEKVLSCRAVLDRPAVAEPFRWFDDAKLGMFIHWGLYSVPARGEWVMCREKIPAADYAKFAWDFRQPKDFSPERWVLLAKRMGAKYAVLTTRHHDGFALWDTKTTDFNAMKVTGRDYVREFADACRKHGLKVGFYYSILNWQYPPKADGTYDPAVWSAYLKCSFDALRELMTDYGKVDLLWYDGCSSPKGSDPDAIDEALGIRRLNAMARELQPGIILNDRSLIGGDFVTPEQSLAAPPRGQRWESCMTVNGAWGYTEKDVAWKSPETLIRSLLHCARLGGNLLLNIGPRADGSVPEECVKRLEALGDYIARCPESVYGARRDAWTEAVHEAGVVTRANGSYWLHTLGNAPRLDNSEEVTKVADGVYHVRFSPWDGPTDWLGGRHDVAIKAGDAPVLGDTTGAYDPEEGPVEPCADAKVRIPAAGKWQVKIGFVDAKGFKDTASFVVETTGPAERTFAVEGAKGYYAHKVSADWRLVPSGRWSLAGVYPGDFVATRSYESIVRANDRDMLALAKTATFVPVGKENEKSRRANERVNASYSAPTKGFGYSLGKTTIRSPRDGTFYAAAAFEYWGDVYVNGERVIRDAKKRPAEPQFVHFKPVAFPIKLKKGDNELLLVNHGGSGAHYFVFYVNFDE